MAKTVFGIPGVQNKFEGGGGAVAPGGAPGAQTGGDLPQKSGKEETPEPPQKELEKPQKPSLDLSGSLGAPSKPPPKKTAMAKPAMATPKGPVMAKPVGPPTGANTGATDAKKTVFGMPAMKLPNAPGAESAPTIPPNAPAAETPAAQTGQDAAYNATVLGMAPGAIEDPAEKAKTEAEVDTGAAEVPTPSQTEAIQEPGKDELGNRAVTIVKKAPPWLLIGIVALIVIALIFVGWIVLGSSDEPSELKSTTTLHAETLNTRTSVA